MGEERTNVDREIGQMTAMLENVVKAIDELKLSIVTKAEKEAMEQRIDKLEKSFNRLSGYFITSLIAAGGWVLVWFINYLK